MGPHIESKDLVLATLKIPDVPAEFLPWVKDQPESLWWYDSFRTCNMINLFTSGAGFAGASQIRDQRSMTWLDYVPVWFRTYIETNLWPMMGQTARMVVFRTRGPKGGSAVHIDCEKVHFGSLQHKLRAVLEGPTDSLFFRTQDGDKYIPKLPHNKWYLIDGSFPHGLTNNVDGFKYTLCIGAPFNGHKEIQKYPLDKVLMSRVDMRMPENLDPYFRKYQSDRVASDRADTY